MITVAEDVDFAKSLKIERKAILNLAEGQLDSRSRGRSIVKSISREVDRLLITAWDTLGKDVSERVDIVAVGGYGRAELCPHSDWDILFLVDDTRANTVNNKIQKFTQVIWDTGATLGHAVRTPAEARKFTDSDHHGCTALLESRLLTGSGKFYTKLMESAAPERWTKKKRIEFCREKIEECTERRISNGGTAFVMEPDCKSGQGGLRDVSTIFWLSMAWYGVPAARDLISRNLVGEQEFNGFIRARDFLWRVRTGLHLLSGREDDRLRFEYQAELAKRFNYRDTEKTSAVERFLKNYFLNVRSIADLSDIFLLHFQEQIKPPSKLAKTRKLGGGMTVKGSKVAISDPKIFALEPLNVLRIFREAQKERRYLNSDALRTLRSYSKLIDATVRSDPSSSKIFLDILRSPRNVATVLNQMQETEVLGRFCPDFRRITGHGQFDRYHQYTVDAHTIRAIDVLRDFALDEGKFINFPLASELMPQLSRPELLYIALLYHDIAKGRGRDHSELGELLARKFCQRLYLSRDDEDLVAWLVLHHLRFSKTAQHYDLSDPKVIEDFASFVGDVERLNYLFLLTVADVTAVGPGTWTDWKGHLFSQLYSLTEASLRTGAVLPQDLESRILARRLSVLERVEEQQKPNIERMLKAISNTLTLNKPPVELLSLTRHLLKESGAAISSKAIRGGTQVLAWGPDRQRLFSYLTAALAYANTKLLSAHAYTLRDGRVMDEFYITDENDRPITESGQINRIRERITGVLGGEEPPTIKVTKPDILMRKLPVTVTRREAAASHVTAIEVVAADRKGLLAELAAVIADSNVDLRGANISTFGEKAVDVFFLSTKTGHRLKSGVVENLLSNLTLVAELGAEEGSA